MFLNYITIRLRRNIKFDRNWKNAAKCWKFKILGNKYQKNTVFFVPLKKFHKKIDKCKKKS